LTAGDSLVGGAGLDTINLSIATVAAPVGGGVSSSGIEALTVTNVNTGAATIDAQLLADLELVTVTGGRGAITVNNLGRVVDVGLTAASADLTLASTAAAVAGTNDDVVVVVDAVALNTDVTVTYNGVETFILDVDSTSGAFDGVTVDNTVTIASTALQTLNVTGAGNIRVSAAFVGAAADAQTATFNASGAEGSVTASIVKGASPSVSVTMSAQGDFLDYQSALARQATLVGGAGTDTLRLLSDVTFSTTATTAAAGSGVSGFEVLRLADNVDVDNRALTNNSGIATVVAEANGSFTSSAISSLTQLGSGTFTASKATDGAADALALTLTGNGVASTLVAAEMETISVVSGGLAANSLTMSAAGALDLTSLTVSGTRSLTATISGVSLATVNASGLTGVGQSFTLAASGSTANMTVTSSSVTPTTEATTANTITTGSGNDVITGSSNIDVITSGAGNDSVTGGAGNDNLTGNAGNDTLSGGDGDDALSDGDGNDVVLGGDGIDTITLGAGTDSVDGGAGNDIITAGANLTTGDTIIGGTGTDTLSATLSAVGVTATLTDIEVINLSFETATFIDLSAATGVTTLTVDSASAGGPNANIRGLASGATVRVTDDNTVGGTAANLAGVSIDTVADASVTVAILANANAATAAASSFTGFTFSDARSVAFTTVGGSATNLLDHQITGNIALDDDDTRTLSITTSADGAFDAVANDVTNSSSLTSFTATAAARADITLDTIADAEDLQTISLTAAGESSDIAVGAIGGGTASTALQTISMAASAGATIATGAITGAGSNLDTVTISATGLNSAVTPGGALTTGNAGINQVTISAADRATVTMAGGDLTVGTGLMNSMAVSATSRGTVNLDGFVSSSTSTVSAGAWSFATSDRGSITGGATGTSAVAINTDGSLSSLTVTVGADSTFDFGDGFAVSAAGTTAATTVTVASDATTSGQLTIGQAGANFTTVTINLAADAANGGDIDIDGGTATTLNVTLNGTANIGVATGVVNFDGNADAIDWAGLTTVTTLNFNVGASSGTNTLSFAANAVKANVTGGSGVDNITGSTGADTISGGAGADVITGGNGADSITGGTGSDTFSYTAATTGSDTITDFTAAAGGDIFAFLGAGIGNGDVTIDAGEIVIHATAVADAAAAVAVIQANTNTTGTLFAIFVTDTDAVTAGDQSATQIYYDANPNTDGGEVLVATLTNIATLTAHNTLTAAANFGLFA